jgi:hypothetical protein
MQRENTGVTLAVIRQKPPLPIRQSRTILLESPTMPEYPFPFFQERGLSDRQSYLNVWFRPHGQCVKQSALSGFAQWWVSRSARRRDLGDREIPVVVIKL